MLSLTEKRFVPPVAEEACSAGRTLPWQLAAMLVVGLLLRLGVAAWLHGEGLYVADENDYDTLGAMIAGHGEYAFQSGTPTSLRPPLYPLLVAGVYTVAGEHNFTAVRVMNAVFGTLTVYLIYLLAGRMYGERAGLVAAFICAFYPSFIATSGLVLTETVFTFLVCACCLLMERYLKTGAAAYVAAFGAALGLAALTRSVLWLFPAPLVLFLLLFDPERLLGRRVLHVGVAVAVFAVVLAPWTIRNTRLQKTFTTVDVMGGRNFMMGNYEHTPMDRPWDAIAISGEKAWHQVLRQKHPEEFKGLTQGQIDKLAMKYAIGYIAARPADTLWRDWLKLGHFWQLEREIVAGLSRGYWGGLPKARVLVAAAAILASYGAVMVLGIFGATAVDSQNWRMHVFVLLLMAYVCGIHSLVFAHSRYHLPLMPLVGMFAAAAWCGRGEIVRHWRQPRVLLAAGVSLVLLAYWASELVTESARF